MGARLPRVVTWRGIHPTGRAIPSQGRTLPPQQPPRGTGRVNRAHRWQAFFQFYVAPPQNPGEKAKLSCQLYQRSADIFLGVPFNIASYALLTHMIAQQCDMDVGDFVWTGGDCHIYSNHHQQVELQLSRAPMAYPTLHIKRRPESIFDYQFEDFEVQGYECHPAIKAPVAV